MRSLTSALVLLCAASLNAADPPAKPSPATSSIAATNGEPHYLLRYKFAANQVLRWQVDHRFEMRTTMGGTTKSAETSTSSTKVWRVHDIDEKGLITFDYKVESIDMRHHLSGSSESHYNSQTDLVPAKGFEDVARAIGVPLAIVKIDARGRVVRREQNPVKSSIPSQGDVTIPMPEAAVAVGEKWTFSHPVDVPTPGGTNRRVVAMQSFELVNVKTGVATISVSTKIMTPVSDPAVEARVIQYETSGTVRFDIDGGQILSQRLALDRGSLGFGGQASSIHYLGRTNEELMPAEPHVAMRAK